MFGGFALEHWKQKPEFYGSEGCFLFSLQPEMAVHRPSNLNQNFMYFNYGMETLPNGLGTQHASTPVSACVYSLPACLSVPACLSFSLCPTIYSDIVVIVSALIKL